MVAGRTVLKSYCRLYANPVRGLWVVEFLRALIRKRQTIYILTDGSVETTGCVRPILWG